MKKNGIFRRILSLLVLLPIFAAFSSCDQADTGTSLEDALPDGMYYVVFTTDSSMFHINEAYENKGILTVKDGEMTVHVTLPSKNTLNLFYGKAEDAKKDGAELINPTVDTVTYSDGSVEEVYGFDIPVPYIGKEFDCALVGKKGTWYDHKVTVSNPVRLIDDGEYTVEVTLKGGSGKASVTSPTKITVAHGKITALIVWSSPYYEYMTLGYLPLGEEEQYLRGNVRGNSEFVIPIVLDEELAVSALTTAMSEPHLIDYTLYFDSSTLIKQ